MVRYCCETVVLGILIEFVCMATWTGGLTRWIRCWQYKLAKKKGYWQHTQFVLQCTLKGYTATTSAVTHFQCSVFSS